MIATASAGAVVSMVTAWLAVLPTLPAPSMIRASYVKLGAVHGGGVVEAPGPSPWSGVASVQVVPPLLLTWIFSPAASAPLLPDTISVVSLVMKSPTVPLSLAIAVIASASAGPVCRW